MAKESYEVAVIGGGPAGYVAAIRAAQLGGRVVLFEKDRVGGTCLNRGCIPTKTYISTAEKLRTIRTGARFGIVGDPSASVDMGKAEAYKDQVVHQLVSGVEGLLRANGVTVVTGEAVLDGERQILCGGERYGAEKIILCGGSEAVRISIPGIDDPDVLTSTELLDLRELPGELAVIGGGVIGCELASAFQAFGSRVTIVEAADRLLPMMDAELARSVGAAAADQGISIYTGKQIDRIGRDGGKICLFCRDGQRIAADKVLLSVGRRTDLSCLGTMAGRIRTENGKIVVDDAMGTSVPNIFAAGDINGRLMLAHAAFRMGEVAAENAVKGTHIPVDLRFVPSCVYTIPQAASVGMSEEEAVAKYGRQALRIGKFPLSANGRSLAAGNREGYVKVIMLERYSEFCGVHIFGPSAAEMIAEPAALMSAEMTVEETADMIHAHPSLSEAFKEACAQAMGRCIHLPPGK